MRYTAPTRPEKSSRGFFFAQNASSGEREPGVPAIHPLPVAAQAINSTTQLPAQPSSCILRRSELRLGRMNLKKFSRDPKGIAVQRPEHARAAFGVAAKRVLKNPCILSQERVPDSDRASLQRRFGGRVKYEIISTTNAIAGADALGPSPLAICETIAAINVKVNPA